MSFFSWLFRRKPPTPAPADFDSEDPFGYKARRRAVENATAHPDRSAFAQGTMKTLEPPRPRPAPQPKPRPIADGQWLMDYTVPGTSMAPRRLLPLFASPPNFFTGIDIDKRRIRTYRTDRMGLIRTAIHPDGRPAALELLERADAAHHRAWALDPGWEVALIMLQDMYAQLALLRLLSVADGVTTEEELDRILAYAKRDNRFAVNEFVPTGDKRAVWPILRELIRQIAAEEQYLDVYIGTVREEWENPRRYKVFTEALTDVANMTEARHPVMTRIVLALNGEAGPNQAASSRGLS